VIIFFLVRAIAHFMDRYGTVEERRLARGNLRNLEKNLLQCHFIYYKSHMKSTRIEPGPSAMRSQHLTSQAMASPHFSSNNLVTENEIIFVSLKLLCVMEINDG
jgi:hypothetical protein